MPDDEAIRAGRELASTEGLLAGISSGAAVYAARLLAVRPEFADKTVVALLPDTGERYLSTELFALTLILGLNAGDGRLFHPVVAVIPTGGSTCTVAWYCPYHPLVLFVPALGTVRTTA